LVLLQYPNAYHVNSIVGVIKSLDKNLHLHCYLQQTSYDSESIFTTLTENLILRP